MERVVTIPIYKTREIEPYPSCEGIQFKENITQKLAMMVRECPRFKRILEEVELKLEEEMSLDKAGQITDFEYEGLAYTLPEGYIFKDENGNVINATKIVLEKKKNTISLTQEQINIMVHESCVLFCKHCGCGVPRDTCTSLGTCDEHDEYKKQIRLYLMEKYLKKMGV